MDPMLNLMLINRWHQSEFSEVGQLSDNIYALSVFNGKLYAGSSNYQGCLRTGRVYRYDGNELWTSMSAN